ncbi:MAG: YcaO-like family protein [Nocardioides sp.]
MSLATSSVANPGARRRTAPVPGVELRALDSTTSVVTTADEAHLLVSLGADTIIRLLDHWRDPAMFPLDAELSRAAEHLRIRLTAPGGDPALAAPPPCGVLPAASTAPIVTARLLLTGDPEMVEALGELAQGSGPSVASEPWNPRAVVNRAYRTGELLVVLVRGPRDSDLIDLDRMCHDMRVPWAPLELTRSRVWLGPVVTPGVGASFEDAVNRRTAAAFDRRTHRVLRTVSLTGDCGLGPTEVPDLLGAALVELGNPDQGDTLHEFGRSETAEVVHTKHTVLPMPSSLTTHRPHQPADLVDPLTGLILRTREIRHDASVPSSLVTRQCDVADIRAVTPWANNVLCQGSSFGDPAGAARSALGESVERYCGNILDTLPVTYGSYDELRRKGAPVLDPQSLVLYSTQQYAEPGFPFVPLTRQTRVHWVPGRSLSSDSEVMVPASLVYVNWYAAGYSSAPITNFCAFAGIAAGPDQNFAVMSGLEEVIERHATMLWWLNGHPLPTVHVPTPLAELWEGTGIAHQRPSLIHLDNDFGVPVVAGIVHDDTDQLVNVGFSARHSFAEAAAKAWTEALTLQEGSRDLLRMDGLHWEVMASGELNGRAFKQWRPDRCYLDDFRTDMRDCDDLMVQQQVYLDPRAGRRMSYLLEPSSTRLVGEIDALTDRSAGTYQARAEAAGYDVIVVDLTTPDVASAGLSVVRVLVPGTIGNAPAAFPFLGRRRVQDLAVQLGWQERPLSEEELNYFPLPHA